MKLPHREYFTIHEVAARWGCTIADVAGWSSKGKLDIVTGIPPVGCGSEIIAGEVFIFHELDLNHRLQAGPLQRNPC